MKKVVPWILGAAVVLLTIAWCVMGLKLHSGDYEIVTEAYLVLVCWIVLLVCLLYKAFSCRCPHCKKARHFGGKYCPHCGKEIEKV